MIIRLSCQQLSWPRGVLETSSSSQPEFDPETTSETIFIYLIVSCKFLNFSISKFNNFSSIKWVITNTRRFSKTDAKPVTIPKNVLPNQNFKTTTLHHYSGKH